MTDRSSSRMAWLRARSTPTKASTTSRRAVTSAPPGRPAGAARSRATSSAARRAAAVAMPAQEGGHAPLAQACGRLWGWIARQEGERDLAFDVGEHGLGAWPEGLQGGRELVDRGHTLADELAPGAHGGPQRSGGGRKRG